MFWTIRILQKNRLKLNDGDELIILNPTPEGKMVVLKLIDKNIKNIIYLPTYLYYIFHVFFINNIITIPDENKIRWWCRIFKGKLVTPFLNIKYLPYTRGSNWWCPSIQLFYIKMYIVSDSGMKKPLKL